MQPYVYRLKDLLTGKCYIGARYAKGCQPEDLGITYFTSSRIVSPLFRANPMRFEKQILVTGDYRYVIKVEKSLITLHEAVLSDEFYNQNCPGTHEYYDRSKGGKIGGKSGGKIGGAKAQLTMLEKYGVNGGVIMNRKTTSAQRSQAGKKSTSIRYRCAECGLTGHAGSLGLHFKATFHNRKEKV